MNINKNFVALYQLPTSHSLYNALPCNEDKIKINEADNLKPHSQEKDSNNLSNMSKGESEHNFSTSIEKLLEEHISDMIELLSKDANKAFQSSFIKQIGIKELYIVQFKNITFLLILGQTITLSG